LAREKELNMEMDMLRRDRQRLLIGDQKKGLLTELEKIENEALEIKDRVNENTLEKGIVDKKLADIAAKEKDIEEEIKVLEKRMSTSGLDDESKKIEEARKAAEEKRRKVEEDRWMSEDELKKIESIRSELREKYQILLSEIKTIKDKLGGLNEELDKQNG
ncbi:MAG: hypothetical protein PHG23_03755, partial [Candidatus Pacebacteria bacterium]|nr:hypothetical protein [Candidatus Paceibacterota bacterium]